MKRWWMIRAGDSNELIPIWVENNIASIGWKQLGNPNNYNTKDELKLKADEEFSDENPRARYSWANQVWRFSNKIHKEDRIITYSKEKREYLIGTVIEPHFYDESMGDPRYPNTIKVKWENDTVARDSLSQSAKNSLGSTLTVFRVDDWGDEIDRVLRDPATVVGTDDEEVEEDEVIEDLIGKSLGMIEDKVDNLDAWEMQELVGGLLKAMGYYAHVSPKGPDGGVDVLAYKDAFGFEKPIIKTQVKHRKSTASSPEIQQLLGAHPMDASCLFVSTGGFTANANSVAKQYSVRLVDIDELVKLIVQWYDKMPHELRAMLPLKKMYVPE